MQMAALVLAPAVWLLCFLMTSSGGHAVAAATQVSLSGSRSSNSSKANAIDPVPEWGLLSAPWTPFHASSGGGINKLNLKMVDLQAAFHKKHGVTHVWAIGGMGQWSTMSVAERKELAQAWVTAGKKHDLFVDIHVGAQALADARELALHARDIGADAIAIIPPSSPSRPSSIDVLIECLKFVTEGVDLPVYYYHIPGQTGVSFKMADFLEQARGVLNIAGIKYVDKDLKDFYRCQEMDGGKYEMFWAPEPKLQSLPYRASRFVLAEAYYGPYLLDVVDAWGHGKVDEALQAQERLNSLQSVISAGESKSVMKMLGIDLGPPRLPKLPGSQAQYDELYLALEKWGFFGQNKTRPWAA